MYNISSIRFPCICIDLYDDLYDIHSIYDLSYPLRPPWDSTHPALRTSPFLTTCQGLQWQQWYIRNYATSKIHRQESSWWHATLGPIFDFSVVAVGDLKGSLNPPPIFRRAKSAMRYEESFLLRLCLFARVSQALYGLLKHFSMFNSMWAFRTCVFGSMKIVGMLVGSA
jgi:hypothetical protein